MNRKAVLFLSGALVGFAGIAFSGANLAAAAASVFTSSTYRALDLFYTVFNQVRRDYVEQPDDSALIEGAVNGMLSSLDPYSRYMSQKDLKAIQSENASNLGDLGLEVTMEDGAIKVISPIDDTPAARAGILANDLIIEIDGQGLDGMTLDQAVGKLRGAVHSPVTLNIVRKGNDKPFDLTLVREKIVVPSVKSREEGQVGYVRITQFSQQTAEELKTAIDKIQSDLGKDKVRGYVIDLRNDPGGPFDQAIAVSDDFLDSGEIVSVRGRKPDQVQRFKATSGDLTEGKPIIVLVNGGSASPSEIVAGALQDHRRATIIGTKSFGKGTVQTIVPIGAKGALRLTTARYYTPSGRSIQAEGIAPDIVVTEASPPELAKAQQPTTGEANPKGQLSEGVAHAKNGSGSIAYVPPDPKDDTQLNYAFGLLRGVQVNAAFPPDQSKGVPN